MNSRLYILGVLWIAACKGTDAINKFLQSSAVTGSLSLQRDVSPTDNAPAELLETEGDMQSTIVKPLQVSLMVCNAYAHELPLDVDDLQAHHRLTASSPVPYSECRLFHLPMKGGDRFEFFSGNLSVGTFYATSAPSTPSSLLLIARRRQPDSRAVAFDSHAFANLDVAQLAVVDAYRGDEAGHLRIMDRAKRGVQRSEDLTFNTVMTLNPGRYQVALLDAQEQLISSSPLDAKGKAKFVVLRIGNSELANASKVYPQSLMVFAEHDEADLAQHKGQEAHFWGRLWTGLKSLLGVKEA